MPTDTDLTTPEAIDAIANDPKVAACWRVLQEARTMHAGGYWPGSANAARVTVEMAKAAWVEAVRDAIAGERG